MSRPLDVVKTYGYDTNNKFPEFPPLMADGRSVISSWQTETDMNDKLRAQSGITSNWEYRKYLTANAVDIMRRDFQEACNDTGFSYMEDTQTFAQFQSPRIFRGIDDIGSVASAFAASTPAADAAAKSSIHQQYLTRQQLEARRISPALTQAQLQQLLMAKNPK